MNMFRRYCYRCQAYRQHERHLNRAGNQVDACTACGHVNSTWQTWALAARGSRRHQPLGATLRRLAA